MLKLKQVIQPVQEPVTLSMIKPQLRIDLDDDLHDEQLIPLISSARDWCEAYQNRAYISQTFELALDRWPLDDKIVLPRPPLQSVVSVKYRVSDGEVKTLDVQNYHVDDFSEPGGLVKASGTTWPSPRLHPINGIKIKYTAGYGDDGRDVPDRVKQAIIMLVCHWFENGIGEKPPPAVYSLLSLDRVVPV